MIQNFQKIRKQNIAGVTSQLLLMRSPFNGQIKGLAVWMAAALAEQAIFNISINGTPQLSGSGRLIIAAASASGEVSGLSLAVSKGDLVLVDAQTVGASGITAPVEINLYVDDLVVVSSITTENVQDIVGAMMISGVNSSWTYDDGAGTLKVDCPQLTDEQIQDKVAAMLQGGGAVSVTYNDAGGMVTISSTNRTDEEIQDLVAAMLLEGSNISLVYNDGAGTLTITASGSGGGSLPAGGSTGQVLTKLSGADDDADWRTPSAGGGSDWDLGNLFALVAQTEDDEFDGSSIDSDWTVTDSGSHVVTHEEFNGRVRSAYVYKSTGNNGVRFFRKPFAPAGDFSVTLCASIYPRENYNVIALSACDSAEQNEYEAGYVFDSMPVTNTRYRISGSDAFGVGAEGRVLDGLPWILLHIQRKSGVWKSAWSNNGVNFHQIYSNSQAITVDHIKIVGGINGGGSLPLTVALHWLRRDWILLD